MPLVFAGGLMIIVIIFVIINLSSSRLESLSEIDTFVRNS
jgi:hypothetical protein